jgi:hypothetical protein
VQKLTGVLEVPAASIIRHTAVSVSILYGKWIMCLWKQHSSVTQSLCLALFITGVFHV